VREDLSIPNGLARTDITSLAPRRRIVAVVKSEGNKVAKKGNTNARKHGLASYNSGDNTPEVEALTAVLCRPNAGVAVRRAGSALARVFVELCEIAGIRIALIEHRYAARERKKQLRPYAVADSKEDDLFGYALAHCEAHSQLKKNSRYERRAQSRFRRSLRQFFYEQEIEMSAAEKRRGGGQRQ
jgi:hypothetical protein